MPRQRQHRALEAVRDELLAGKVQSFEKRLFALAKGGTRRSSSSEAEAAEEREEVEIWEDSARRVRREQDDDPSLATFLQEMALKPKTRPRRADEVPCLTVHQAKGGGYPHVYLVGMVEEELPSYRALHSEDPAAIEEERRVCFVAITRAESSLTMTYHTRFQRWSRQPSRFLFEMGPKVDEA